MFLAVHASVGAIAGNAVQNPLIAFVIGFISHFFTDMVPHGDENMYEGYKNGNKVVRAVMYVAADAVLTVVRVALFFIKEDFFHPMNVAMGIVGGLLPDLLVGLYEILKPQGKRWWSRKLMAFHAFHMKNHHFVIGRVRKEARDIPLRYGLALQAVTMVVLMKIIF